MNKIFKIVLVLVFGLSLTNCTNSDSTAESVPLRDQTEQKNSDDAKLIKFFKEHKMNVDPVTFDVTFDKVAPLSADCMWIKNQNPTTSPYIIATRTCFSSSIPYTIYYISFRQGINITKKPCNLDGVFTAYKGRLVSEDDKIVVGTPVATNVGTVFDSNDNPSDYFNLDGVIRGWSEIFPLFAPGTYTANPDGTNSYSDFGAGVMFIPSGLAYFNGAPGSIPSYSPLIFNFKLYEVRRNDHDFDGIEDFNEDLNRDGYIYFQASNTVNNTVSDDTDGDNIPDAYDQDDDGDRYNTRSELKKPDFNPLQYDGNGVKINSGFFNYTDVPDAGGNVSNPNRKRRYLDSTWKPI